MDVTDASTSPALLRVRHVTTYRYDRPVRFGEHRVLFRPREAHDIGVISATVAVNVEADVRWIHDVHSNSVAIVAPKAEASELRFECTTLLNHWGTDNLELPLEERALTLPVAYNAEERQVLVPWLAAVDEDPNAEVAGWAKGFVQHTDDTRVVLQRMLSEIRDGFAYQAREAEGTQPAAETLRRRSGTCRDYAWLMIEALRSIGVACRFVTGYLYDPTLDANGDDGDARLGAGATHAWLQVYLPGAGWVPYDPTNRLTGGTDLIRVGYARRPQDAVPLAGSWFGEPQAYRGMTVEVTVERL
jgi:transglutaminase-like putative cysteine protease